LWSGGHRAIVGRVSRGRWVVYLLVLGAAFSLGGSSLASTAARSSTWNLTGTWIGQDDGVFVVKQSGSTVTWYGHAADNKTWAHDFKGTITGDYLVGHFKDRPGFTNRYEGDIAIHIVDNDSFVWIPSHNGVTSLAILTRSWTRKTDTAKAKLPTFTSVVCNIVVNGPGSTCAAQVADESPLRGYPPTGTVNFTAQSGTVGKSCILAGTPGSPGIASCTVSYVPSANLVQGEPPPVSAAYSGDGTFSPSSGNSSYKPASVLVPPSVPIDLTGTGSQPGSNEGIPTDLVNQNAFPVSADEQLTVSGAITLSVDAKPRVIGHLAVHLKPLAVVAARIKLSATGRALLRKHRSLHASLRVTTRAAGKPTTAVTAHVLLKAR